MPDTVKRFYVVKAGTGFDVIDNHTKLAVNNHGPISGDLVAAAYAARLNGEAEPEPKGVSAPMMPAPVPVPEGAFMPRNSGEAAIMAALGVLIHDFYEASTTWGGFTDKDGRRTTPVEAKENIYRFVIETVRETEQNARQNGGAE